MDNFCEIEMTLDEVALLRNLLKVETVYQVRYHVTQKEETDDTKVVKIISTFDTHNWLDQQLLSILNEIKKNEASAQESLVNLVLVNKKVARLYKLLVTETPKVLNVKDVKENWDKLGENLKEKILAALEKAESKEASSIPSNIPINMGGVGIA